MTSQQNLKKGKKKKIGKICWKSWQLGIWVHNWPVQVLSRHVLPPAASLMPCQRMPCLINTTSKHCWRLHWVLLFKRLAFPSRCILIKGKAPLLLPAGGGSSHGWAASVDALFVWISQHLNAVEFFLLIVLFFFSHIHPTLLLFHFWSEGALCVLETPSTVWNLN